MKYMVNFIKRVSNRTKSKGSEKTSKVVTESAPTPARNDICAEKRWDESGGLARSDTEKKEKEITQEFKERRLGWLRMGQRFEQIGASPFNVTMLREDLYAARCNVEALEKEIDGLRNGNATGLMTPRNRPVRRTVTSRMIRQDAAVQNRTELDYLVAYFERNPHFLYNNDNPEVQAINNIIMRHVASRDVEELNGDSLTGDITSGHGNLDTVMGLEDPFSDTSRQSSASSLSSLSTMDTDYGETYARVKRQFSLLRNNLKESKAVIEAQSKIIDELRLNPEARSNNMMHPVPAAAREPTDAPLRQRVAVPLHAQTNLQPRIVVASQAQQQNKVQTYTGLQINGAHPAATKAQAPPRSQVFAPPSPAQSMMCPSFSDENRFPELILPELVLAAPICRLNLDALESAQYAFPSPKQPEFTPGARTQSSQQDLPSLTHQPRNQSLNLITAEQRAQMTPLARFNLEYEENDTESCLRDRGSPIPSIWRSQSHDPEAASNGMRNGATSAAMEEFRNRLGPPPAYGDFTRRINAFDYFQVE